MICTRGIQECHSVKRREDEETMQHKQRAEPSCVKAGESAPAPHSSLPLLSLTASLGRYSDTLYLLFTSNEWILKLRIHRANSVICIQKLMT